MRRVVGVDGVRTGVAQLREEVVAVEEEKEEDSSSDTTGSRFVQNFILFQELGICS